MSSNYNVTILHLFNFVRLLIQYISWAWARARHYGKFDVQSWVFDPATISASNRKAKTWKLCIPVDFSPKRPDRQIRFCEFVRGLSKTITNQIMSLYRYGIFVYAYRTSEMPIFYYTVRWIVSVWIWYEKYECERLYSRTWMCKTGKFLWFIVIEG